MKPLICLLLLLFTAVVTAEEWTAEELAKERAHKALQARIRVIVKEALELGATPDEIRRICRLNPTCLDALEDNL